MDLLKKLSLEDIYRLISLNFLWILYTAAGLGLFGFFPAFYALHRCLFLFFHNKKDGLVKEFHRTFKRNFFKMNLCMLPFLLVGVILGTDYYFAVMVNSKVLLFVVLFLVYYANSLFHLFFPAMLEKGNSFIKSIQAVYRLPFFMPKKFLLIFFYYLLIFILGTVFPVVWSAFLFVIPHVLMADAYWTPQSGTAGTVLSSYSEKKE